MNSKNLEAATALRHELHRNPELSMQESWTKNYLLDFIKQHTALEVVNRGEWFYAAYNAGEGKPCIAFRADFDAIAMDDRIDRPYTSKNPGVAHKCGHDGHSAILAGLAMEIDQNGADKNIVFLFQPGEETGQGALRCLGVFDERKIDEMYALHNMPGIPYGAVALKKGGELYTPSPVVQLMVRLIKPVAGNRVYDMIMHSLIQFNDCRRSLCLQGK